LDYWRFVAQQLPIGSGAVESLIDARLKQAGMRWTPTSGATLRLAGPTLRGLLPLTEAL
jgi:hypothetical protein